MWQLVASDEFIGVRSRHAEQLSCLLDRPHAATSIVVRYERFLCTASGSTVPEYLGSIHVLSMRVRTLLARQESPDWIHAFAS
jgi:hypothetical protein